MNDWCWGSVINGRWKRIARFPVEQFSMIRWFGKRSGVLTAAISLLLQALTDQDSIAVLVYHADVAMQHLCGVVGDSVDWQNVNTGGNSRSTVQSLAS